MARIRDRTVKESSGAYVRLFGNPELGALITRVHSAVIASGMELEKLILTNVEEVKKLDEFLKQEIMPDGIFIASKQAIKDSELQISKGFEPSFLIFNRRKGQQDCHVVELKDGNQFDTMRSSAEQQNMQLFIEENNEHLQHYAVCAHYCCFNEEEQSEVVKGFKGKIELDEALTGKELCKLLEIDYDEIVNRRKISQPDNTLFFLSELVKIEEVKEILQKLLGKANNKIK